MDKNIHTDHRQRVRSLYLSSGIAGMADHNIIELLLFYGIPYKDTNSIAHELIEAFGDLNGVLDAPVEDLVRISGIGENTAALIHLTHDIIEKYNSHLQDDKIFIGTFDRFSDYLSMKYMGENREVAYILCIDSHGRIQQCIKIGEGSPESATISNRTIIEAAIRSNAKDMILTHNHPSGFSVPSVIDVKSTQSLVPLLRSININLIDHIIVADDGCFSMAKSAKYMHIFSN